MELAHNAESDYALSPVCSPWDPPCWTFSSPKEYPTVHYTLTLPQLLQALSNFPKSPSTELQVPTALKSPGAASRR